MKKQDNQSTAIDSDLSAAPCSANLEDLIARCEKLHSYMGWYCMSCDSETDATYEERCTNCGAALHDGTITGNLIEAAKDELEAIKQTPVSCRPKNEDRSATSGSASSESTNNA